MPLKTKPLSEQVALVTGGGTGIGRAFAEALSQGGHQPLREVMNDECGMMN